MSITMAAPNSEISNQFLKEILKLEIHITRFLKVYKVVASNSCHGPDKLL